MNIVSILTAVAVIGSSIFALEGLNLATGGEFYLASVQNLVQNSVEPIMTTPTATEPSRDVMSGSVPTLSGQVFPSTPIQTTGEPIMQPFAPIQTDQPMMNNIRGEPVRQEIMPNIKLDCPDGKCIQNQVIREPGEIRNGKYDDRRQDRGEKNRDNNQIMEEEEGNQMMDFVDPNEVKRVLKEITNMRSEIKRTISQNKKTVGASDLSELNAVLAEADKAYTAIKNSSDEEMRSNMQEFYEGQYWERIQAVRTRLEIPRELKQMAPIFRRLEKTLATKAIQNIGLDIARAKQRVAEMKQLMNQVQTAYNSGDMETAQEAMQELRESGGHPGEIEGTIFRFRDIKNMVKRVKDEAVRNEVDSVLQEVVDAFNNGDYREARETMDEYADDLQRLLSTLMKTKMNTKTRTDSINKINNLENLIQSKLQSSQK